MAGSAPAFSERNPKIPISSLISLPLGLFRSEDIKDLYSLLIEYVSGPLISQISVMFVSWKPPIKIPTETRHTSERENLFRSVLNWIQKWDHRY